MNKLHKLLLILFNTEAKKYASIGGQAVIEGVMMRSPNAFVIAVRKPDGTIRLRRDQWFGLSKKWSIFKKPFLRGVLVLVETMANGIVSLNYSANVAMDEELRKEAMDKGMTEEEYEKQKQKKEKIDWMTFMTIGFSFIFGMGLFIFLPHGLTALLENLFGASWGVKSFEFHFVDGVIKAIIFISYVSIIGLLPDIKRVFQYHGAEHKSISTFEAKEELTVENARKYPTFHPRCGTTFVFFLLFISIILFAVIFAIVPVGEGYNKYIKHLFVILCKIGLTFPIAGISYELIKLMGKNTDTSWGKIIGYPGMLLQRLTTREPDDEQLEVALSSIRAVIDLESRFELNDAKSKKISMEEADLNSYKDIHPDNYQLQDFLEP
ncbi:MAG: DUF1385 domain-containing protein [Bdellovibrionales bacterium]|nr:DUF1385 domain-containing protein [Bdellovibrionales bacterium]